MKDELKTWLRTTLDHAVKELGDLRLFEDAMLEAKPAWMLPMKILVGKVREPSDPKAFRWFICGQVPLDALDGSIADTPRDALRHFSMKWQLGAEALEGDTARELIDVAESIYELAEDDRAWE